jgi:hypothetical protein
VYLVFSITHAYHEAWLIKSCASLHMNPYKEWLCEYGRYYGGNVFVSDESIAKIVGWERFKLRLIDGRIITLPGVLHIPGLAKNFIFVRKMDDAGVKIVFEKETCRMVRGAMVLLKGVWIGTLYKLQGDGCNSSIALDIGDEEEKTPTLSGEKVMLWNQSLGHIREIVLRLLHRKGVVEGMYICSLYFYLCEHCVYGK